LGFGTRRELEPDHRFVAALANLLLYQIRQGLVGFVVNLHVCITR
jgi:hypothetical protein